MSPPRRKKSASPSSNRASRSKANLAIGKSGCGWLDVARVVELEFAASLPEDSRLPTEAALAQQLGVNRYALRRALAVLLKKGVLRAVPHVGYFVGPRRLKLGVGTDMPAIEGLVRSGMQVTNTLVSQRTCTPPVLIASRLGVAKRTVVIELVHRTTTNGNSFSQVTTWLPADRFDRIGMLVAASGSVGAALAQMGVGRTRCKAVNVLTRPANPDEANVLELQAAARVLVIDSLIVDASGEPTHLSQCIVDADRVELAIEL